MSIFGCSGTKKVRKEKRNLIIIAIIGTLIALITVFTLYKEWICEKIVPRYYCKKMILEKEKLKNKNKEINAHYKDCSKKNRILSETLLGFLESGSPDDIAIFLRFIDKNENLKDLIYNDDFLHKPISDIIHKKQIDAINYCNDEDYDSAINEFNKLDVIIEVAKGIEIKYNKQEKEIYFWLTKANILLKGESYLYYGDDRNNVTESVFAYCKKALEIEKIVKEKFKRQKEQFINLLYQIHTYCINEGDKNLKNGKYSQKIAGYALYYYDYLGKIESIINKVGEFRLKNETYLKKIKKLYVVVKEKIDTEPVPTPYRDAKLLIEKYIRNNKIKGIIEN